MRLRLTIMCFVFGLSLSASAPVKKPFTDAEQQQISIQTPGLFEHSDAFNVDFTALKDSEYSFPLPVGKSVLAKHNVLEIHTSAGDAVKAMFDGTVRLSRHYGGDMGNVIVIRHRNGLETVYANNAQNLVETGQRVKAGETIAIVGSRGGKAVCDFSVMVNGGRINPATIIEPKSHRLRRQTLLFEKAEKGVNVSVLGTPADFDDAASSAEPTDIFAHASTYKWNLQLIDKSKWAYPLPGAKVISPYGGKRRHSGVDLKTKPHDKILAAFDGVVTRSGSFSGYGLCIVIKHDNGLETLYSHQSKNLVKAGERVKAGQVIGLTGRTGRATTEHLHLEVMYKGRRVNPNIIFDHRAQALQPNTVTLTKAGGITSKRNAP